MRLVSPVLEAITTPIGRAIDDVVRSPRELRRMARVGHALPGHSRDPVFIVPGLTADRWVYRRGAEMLEDEGFIVGGMRMPWHGWSGIPGDARLMREGVERTIERAQRMGRDVDRVQLLGDSEGGLIGRWFLQFEDGQPLVSRFVSHGTPHNGIRPLGSDALAAITRNAPLPGGVRDLIVGSSVMRSLNDDWLDFIARARAADPHFEAHSIASRLGGRLRHDGLVPEHAARLPGEAPAVTNYVTSGAHSVNLAYGRRQSEAGHVLLAALGSRDEQALAAAARARAAAQAADGAAALG